MFNNIINNINNRAILPYFDSVIKNRFFVRTDVPYNRKSNLADISVGERLAAPVWEQNISKAFPDKGRLK